jgi:hypothetical protein
MMNWGEFGRKKWFSRNLSEGTEENNEKTYL